MSATLPVLNGFKLDEVKAIVADVDSFVFTEAFSADVKTMLADSQLQGERCLAFSLPVDR